MRIIETRRCAQSASPNDSLSLFMTTQTPNPVLSKISSPQAAIDAVCARVIILPTETVALANSCGRVLAKTLHADRDSPALDLSSMDGFAIKISDALEMASEIGLPVATTSKQGQHEARIGHAPIAMPVAHAVRIVTGAPIPLGSDAVVRHEDVSRVGNHVRLTIDPASIKNGANIRRQGENAKSGAEIAPAGLMISAATIGALASFGVSQVQVHRRVRVAIVITGDELVSIDGNPQPWEVRDSNGPVLQALLGTRAWIEIVSCAHAVDDANSLTAILAQAMKSADAVILTGGVSMGHRDFVPQVVTQLGAETIFHKLPQRPGRPMMAAVRPASATNATCLILGLPGNPISVMTTARRLGIPMLGAIAGLSRHALAPAKRVLASDDHSTLAMWWFRLVGERLGTDGCSELHLLSGKGSGDVATAATSVGFVEIAPDKTTNGLQDFYAWNA